MRNKERIIIIVFITIIGMVLFIPTKSQAVLQANGGTPAAKNLNTWLLEVRQMQQTGGALGLTDEIDGNLKTTNKNLDIHMQKNTEFGAMAILSASDYGKPEKVGNGETTTGNSTGIKVNINREWVSAGCTQLSSNVPRFGTAAGRYKDIYTTSYVEKKVMQ